MAQLTAGNSSSSRPSSKSDDDDDDSKEDKDDGGDHLGVAVAVYGDTVAAGAPNHRNSAGVRVGAVCVVLGQKWTEVHTLSPADLSEDAYFGYSLAVQDSVMMVSAYDAAGDGLVFVYGRQRGQLWAIRSILRTSSALNGYFFGESLSVMEYNLQGPSLAVGRNASTNDSSSSSSISKGSQCAATTAVLAVGAPGAGEQAGAVYVFATLPYFSEPHCSAAAGEGSEVIAVDEASTAQLSGNDSRPFSAFGDSLCFGECVQVCVCVCVK